MTEWAKLEALMVSVETEPWRYIELMRRRRDAWPRIQAVIQAACELVQECDWCMFPECNGCMFPEHTAVRGALASLGRRCAMKAAAWDTAETIDAIADVIEAARRVVQVARGEVYLRPSETQPWVILEDALRALDGHNEEAGR